MSSLKKKHLNIVTGFLGAGKTSTILNYLNSNLDQKQKILVLVNEIGKENFDTIKIQQNSKFCSDLEVINVPGGCICCSSKVDFSRNLFKIAESDQIDRVIIEPSGLARISDILDLIESTQLKDLFIVHAVICVTHPQWPVRACPIWEQQLADQIDAAQVIISNFTDIVDPTYEVAFEEYLKTKSTPKQLVVKTSHGVVDSKIFDLMPQPTSYLGGEKGISTKGFKTFQKTWSKEEPFKFDEISHLLLKLKRDFEIVRMKSYFNTDRGWFSFELNQDIQFCEPTEYRLDQRIQIISTKEVEMPF